MAQLVEHITISRLTPWPKNARAHSRKQVRQIAESIEAFGFTNPVLVDEDNTILAGHGRVEAAKLLGRESVPCVRVNNLSPARKRAYVLADNKLALNASWDEEILGSELQALLVSDLGLDLGITGFAAAEIDRAIEGLTVVEDGNPEDDVLPSSAVPSRCAPGDIWQLGANRLICGDARDKAVVAMLMDGEQAEMVFSDPPYNVQIDGHASGLGATHHREFAMASGEMTSTEFTRFLETVFRNLAEHSKDGSIHLLCMDWRHMAEILAAGNAAYDELKNLIVWVKDNGGMGTFYRSRHELIFVFKKGTVPHINSFELGQHGRYRTNVWQYKGVNSFKAGRSDEARTPPDGQAGPDDR